MIKLLYGLHARYSIHWLLHCCAVLIIGVQGGLNSLLAPPHYLCGDAATATAPSSLLLVRPDRPPSFAFRLPHERRTSPPAPLPAALEGRGEGEY